LWPGQVTPLILEGSQKALLGLTHQGAAETVDEPRIKADRHHDAEKEHVVKEAGTIRKRSLGITHDVLR
jgi:hypothetical protein